MAEEPTKKINKGRTTDKNAVREAVAQLESRPVAHTDEIPTVPQDLLPEQAKPGFFSAMARAMAPPLLCGVLAALLIWIRYLPPLPGLLPGWLGWCLVAALVPLASRRAAVLFGLGAFIGIPVLALTLATNYRLVRVEGESMSPTLLPGDVLLIDLKGNPGDFARPGAEIYVLDLPSEKNHPLIKRLVGVSGQELIVRDGRLYADGERVFPASDSLQAPRVEYRGHLQPGLKLADNQYFFLGDNPSDSRDSRQFNSVAAQSVEGRAVWRLKGPSGFGRLP